MPPGLSSPAHPRRREPVSVNHLRGPGRNAVGGYGEARIFSSGPGQAVREADFSGNHAVLNLWRSRPMRLNIRTQLLAGFAAVTVVMIGSMAYAIYALSSLNHDANTIGKSAMPSSAIIDDIKWATTDYRLKDARYVLNGDPKVLAGLAPLQ